MSDEFPSAAPIKIDRYDLVLHKAVPRLCPITQAAVEFLPRPPPQVLPIVPMNHSPVSLLYQLLLCTKLGLSQLGPDGY